MNRWCRAVTLSMVLFMSVSGISFCQEIPLSPVSEDYGQALVENVLRVNAQCWVFCDIADWPAIIGREIPVQIRGLDPQSAGGGFELSVREFIFEILTDALKQNSASVDPNAPAGPKVVLKHIQRAKEFCLVADVEVNGQDLAQMLVDKGYAKKLIIPKNASSVSAVPTAADQTNAESATVAGGFVASKSGKVFHKSTCPHARRIQDDKKVIYQTREEVINAGRRPCQTCNP